MFYISTRLVYDLLGSRGTVPLSSRIGQVLALATKLPFFPPFGAEWNVVMHWYFHFIALIVS